MWGKRLWGTWLVVALIALVGASGAAACSCAPQPPGESLRESDAAIVGRLVKVLPHGPLHADFRYEVRHVYKGANSIDASQILDVRSSRRAAACALPRRTERSYGLFLSHRHGRWFGGICGVIAPQRLRATAQHQSAGSARAPVQPVLCG
ncbi:MAG: Tissue inhibitor of metalloproteinase [Solirubrobacterales bacterium]|jgi:hypothetical protein|nr:Tissue inhibitor of metalloproteinase [Solirubrobacterales bacterium]